MIYAIIVFQFLSAILIFRIDGYTKYTSCITFWPHSQTCPTRHGKRRQDPPTYSQTYASSPERTAKTDSDQAGKHRVTPPQLTNILQKWSLELSVSLDFPLPVYFLDSICLIEKSLRISYTICLFYILFNTWTLHEPATTPFIHVDASVFSLAVQLFRMALAAKMLENLHPPALINAGMAEHTGLIQRRPFLWAKNEGIGCVYTPRKINMEPTNHPFWEENDLPNLHEDMFQPFILGGVILQAFSGMKIHHVLSLAQLLKHVNVTFVRPLCKKINLAFPDWLALGSWNITESHPLAL